MQRELAEQHRRNAKLEQEVARLRAPPPRVDPQAESARREPTRAQAGLGVMIALFTLSLGVIGLKACQLKHKHDAAARIDVELRERPIVFELPASDAAP
ncbi:MAG: hypothetical protein ABI867_25100 [Kofleriaceae bacterium]